MNGSREMDLPPIFFKQDRALDKKMEAGFRSIRMSVSWLKHQPVAADDAATMIVVATRVFQGEQ